MTVNVLPAIVRVPLRCLPWFCATRNVTVPFPLPVAPVRSVIHDALLVAVQVHPAGAETEVVPTPPFSDGDMLDGLIEYEQLAVWVTVKV